MTEYLIFIAVSIVWAYFILIGSLYWEHRKEGNHGTHQEGNSKGVNL